MKARSGRVVSTLVMSAMLTALLPQVAYAAPVSDDDGKGVVDTVKGWFTDDDDGSDTEPPTDDAQAVRSREKLPKGKKAPKAKRVKELKSKRTPNARFWKLSDGRVQAEVSAVPTSYRDGKAWKSIDTTLHSTKRKGYAFANTTNRGRSYFSSDPGQLLHYEVSEDTSVTIGLVDPAGKHLDPKADGDTVTYPDAVHGGKLTYQVEANRVKENITLTEHPDKPVSFTFSLDTEGLRPKARKDGSIAFYGEGRQPVFEIPAPFMTDAKKSKSSPYGHVYSTDVTQKLTRHGDTWRVTVTPDAKWLASDKREYPVVIDPTITLAPTPTQSQDTMVISSSPDSNYDGSWRLSVGTTPSGISRSLVKFDLSGVPEGAQLDAAQLKLYYDQTHTANNRPVKIGAYQATGPWDAATATWNNTESLLGGQSANTVTVDDGDAGTTAANGSWPSSGSSLTQYAVGKDYHYNKDDSPGDAYTWQPKLGEDGDYTVEAHYVPAFDRATAAPYTVTYDGGSKSYTVDQSAGSGGEWATLGTLPFKAGTTGKVVLGDDPASSSTAVLADAMRFTKPATDVMQPNVYNKWHTFSVKDTVQDWLNGTANNYGFILKATDESTLGRGGPRYEASEFGYGGETATYPKLVLSFGKPSVTLHQPRTIHATGAELNWDTYTNASGDTSDDIVEYQVHRSIYQNFTPSASTLVAPVDKGTTSFTDTSATPTATDDPDPFGRAYYYMVAVKTKSGEVLPAPTQLVRLPKAGRTIKVIPAAQDTTLSSAEPDLSHDTISDTGVLENWDSVGNNSPTFGRTRTLVDFSDLGIPSSARVLDATVRLWGTLTNSTSAGAVYELHGLSHAFDENATWNTSDGSSAWSSSGGDFDSTVVSTLGNVTNDPSRRDWNITSLAQQWVNDPSTNKGALIKLADESASGPQERTLFLSSEGDESQLHPHLVVTYIDSTTASTYYGPQTPARMIPGDTYPVDVTVTNTTGSKWTAAGQELSYRWSLPDGTDATTGGNQIVTPLPEDLLPGETVTLHAQVKSPINSDSGNKRNDYVLTWDVRNTADGSWVSDTANIPGLAQNVAVEDPTSNQLGLEKFYSYAGKNTGAGSTAMTNLYAGNTVWSYNAFSNPGRGLSTFARFSYNSLDTSDTVLGDGWSAQLASPLRQGASLDFHPNPNPTTVTLPDGDGTSHTFRLQADGTWKAPAGVHYLLEQKPNVDCKPSADGDPQAWSMTRPDRTKFYFDCDGYLTSIVDKNGNTQTYTYAERKSHNKPVKFLEYITDPSGRRTLTVDYYAKGEDYTYIDDTGVEQPGTKLTNPKIIDHVRSMTDISGRTVTFVYTGKGLLAKLTDGAGAKQPKVFRFTYDATQGNKNVKLVKVTDPRGHATSFDYYYPQTGDDPQFHWATKTITDRLGYDTSFAYTDPDGTAGSFIDTDVTDAESHTTHYTQDGYGRPTQITNAKSQTTKLSWDADNNVTRLEEPNGAVTTYAFDPKTGYPTKTTSAEANKNGTAGTTLEYATSLNGYVADLWRKTSPEGRTWQFGYDGFGNLTSVTDPKGVATATAGDYMTTYDYNSYGQLTKATDANGHATTSSDFGPTGYPATITDALGDDSVFSYDERGNVLSAVDALGAKTTQTYDAFGRPLEGKTPKDASAGEYIVTPAPVYDANDNVVRATAPNGAVSTAVYDDADQITAATAPKDTSTSGERKSTYTYDKVGNLLTTVEPKGNLTATAGDYTTTNAYDAIYQLASVTNAKGDKITYSYDDVGNVTKVVDPRKNETTDTTDYTTKTAYDLNHRVTSATDAAGNTSSRAYDKDGLVVAKTDAEGNTTEVSYSERGKPVQVKVPHSKDGSGTITYRTTKFVYDQVGNRTKVITPRGVATTADDEDFVAETVYDKLNRPVQQIQPYDPDDARYNKPIKTLTTYDAVGRVAKTSMPPSEGQSVRNETTYSYFDNGWAKSSTNPWDIVTTYDYNQLGKQTARTLTSAGGSSSRTMGWSYYPDGKLKSRSDDGVPVGTAVVLVDNSDTQNTATTGTWSTGQADGEQGFNHASHAAGTGSDTYTWTLNIPKDGTYTAYVKYPAVTGAATDAPFTLTHASGTTAKSVDETANAGEWVSLGSYSFTKGNDAKLELGTTASGTVVADAVKLVRDTSGVTDTEARSFTYTYDVNGNLTHIEDSSSSAEVDAYDIAYTGLNQVKTVTEYSGGTAGDATSYTYNANGSPLTLSHPEQYSSYTYDLRNLVSKVSVGKSSSDTDPKVTTFDYTKRGQKQDEVKGNGNIVTYGYYLDGALKSQVETKPGGTLVAKHDYAYDPNGNKAQDVSKKMNADDHSAYLSATKDYTYDPADRLAKVVTTGTGAGTETYVHDANANVISQTVDGTTTTYTYDRNRLLSSSAGGTTASYNYDPFGRLNTVTSSGKIIQSKEYDGFDHVIKSTKLTDTGETKSTSYTFDPLDRTTSKTSGGKTTDFDYLGLSSQVLDEEVAGKLTKSYQYSPWGARLSQVTHNDDGTTEDAYYGYNSHTDVETLTTDSGDTKATYGYTAYGSNDEDFFTGIDKPDPTSPDKEAYNPYRYNSKRWDAGSETYDMGFRNYSPGLNRFTTRDMYAGALANMGLSTDPFTANRYAFTGGNPISFIELDGHMYDVGHAGGTTYKEANKGDGDNGLSAEQAEALKNLVDYYTKETCRPGHMVSSGPLCQTQAEADFATKSFRSALADSTVIIPGIRCTLSGGDNQQQCDILGVALSTWDVGAVEMAFLRGAGGREAVDAAARLSKNDILTNKVDHIVLGSRYHGLEDLTKKLGGRHLLADSDWRGQVVVSADLLKMDYEGVKVSFSLDGLGGGTPDQIVHQAVRKDALNTATPTEWELATYRHAGVLGKIDFYQGGQKIDNPWD